MFIEWVAIGRPESRSDEYSGLLTMQPPCATLLDSNRLQDYILENHELDQIVHQLLMHLKRRGSQYLWVSYLLKGMSGFDEIEASMTTFVEEEWLGDERGVTEVIMIHFNFPLNPKQYRVLKAIIKNAKPDVLKGQAQQKLRFSQMYFEKNK